MMHNPILLTGTQSTLPPLLPLTAGVLNLSYEAGTLRYIRLGEIEVLRQIYAAVRDENWGTVPGTLINLVIEHKPDSFHIRYDSLHQQGGIDFRWQAQIHREADGALRFEMRGKAHSTFKRNRIGFCILHPMTCAGMNCRIEHVDGTVEEGVFPEHIAPHQPFRAIRAIQHEYAPGQWIEVRMEGDTFEMEDQRNWLDASFKTYCTPLDLTFPMVVEAGTEITQVITVKVLNAPAKRVVIAPASAITLTLQPDTKVPLPALGLALPQSVEVPSETIVEHLRRLKLSHLRVDIHFKQQDWQTNFENAVKTANAVNTALEVAVHLTNAAEQELQAINARITELQPRIARWLIFHDAEKSTSARWVTLARKILGSGTPIVSGTDAFFTELNRERPATEYMDGVVYSVNPQVHAFDDASLVETLPVHATTLESARQFAAGKPIHISPITFKMRWNPNATAPARPHTLDELPPQADPRQMSLFGAIWTMGSIKYSALGGAASLSYYETVGYLGVMPSANNLALPDQFWAIPDGVYPLYHVLADVGEFAGGTLHQIATNAPLSADAIALTDGEKQRLLVANMTRQTQSVVLSGVLGSYRVRKLDETTAEFAMREPAAYRAALGDILTTKQNTLHLELQPYALLTLDREPA